MIVRYLLEKCKNVSEAVSCLYQLPIASAQTLTLADTMGAIAVIECNAEQIKVEKHWIAIFLLSVQQTLSICQKW